MTRYIFYQSVQCCLGLIDLQCVTAASKRAICTTPLFGKKTSFLQREGTVVVVSAARYDADYIIPRISGDGYALIPY